jgi:hypothetical protein
MSNTNMYDIIKDLMDVDAMEPAPEVINASVIRDRKHTIKGWVTVQGIILNGVRNKAGKVDGNGKVLSLLNTPLGSVDEAGNIRNHFGLLMGRITDEGIIRSINDLKVGSVKDMNATSRTQAGGAALILLLGDVQT